MKRFWSWGAALLLFFCALMAEQPAQAEGMIPIVTITADSLSNWTGKQDVREAVLAYRDFVENVYFTRNITIRPQGTSSLAYDKKNFTVVLDEGVELQPGWGSQKKYCLKANFIDPTQAANVVSARLAGEMYRSHHLLENAPNNGMIDGFPVWVILNGEDAGLYTWNIPKADWMFAMDEADENHIVMCAEEWTPACGFMQKDFEVGPDWSFEVGEATPENVQKFKRLLTFVSTSSDDYFKEHLSEYLDLEACLDYFCFVMISFGVDNQAKNMLMATYDGMVWMPVLYDMDSTWGISWDGQSCIVQDASWEGFTNGHGNLAQKLYRNFPDEFRSRYCELRGGVLSTEHIRQRFEEFAGTIPQGCYERDWQMWNSDGVLIRTLDYMYELMDTYLPYLDAHFGFDAQSPEE